VPLVTGFNLRPDDRLPEIEEAVRVALTSMLELGINDFEVDLVPVLAPEGFHGTVTRINVDLWERSVRTKAALQELATRVATAFQAVTGRDRKVKVVIRPYDVEARGWISL
jgi:phenylpyruvate tautomerase PptA (4-oxalocrotonate tautomerase family)